MAFPKPFTSFGRELLGVGLPVAVSRVYLGTFLLASAEGGGDNGGWRYDMHPAGLLATDRDA
jgi:hypothetical protein